MISREATTRSLKAVGVCNVNTVKVANDKAPNAPALAARPSRLAIPKIAMHAKTSARSWTPRRNGRRCARIIDDIDLDLGDWWEGIDALVGELAT